MSTLIRLADGTEITVVQDDKLVARAFDDVGYKATAFVRLSTENDVRVWVNPAHVASFESRGD